MKIKELHIRNIASIEKADINFEKNLNDPLTGEPSSIFLIAGDTGAGKSVILDAISMALYKDTPRLSGVVNKKNNSFNDSAGNAINVNSIEQYRRIGTSWDDVCYSEVVFEGNDGKVYGARLSLDMAKKRKTGGAKLKPARWEWRAGDSNWQKVSSNDNQIEKLIGLSFEQFGRMAMLAQGQFASFLVGDKTERESILEQLTNTEHFTQYGIAISELWKRKKGDWEQSKSTMDTARERTLLPEVVSEKKARLVTLTKASAEITEKIQAIDRQLAVLDQIALATQKKEEATAETVRLQTEQQGDAYKHAVRLTTDWQATEQERFHYELLQKERQALLVVQAEKEGQKTQLAQLMGDLAVRKERLFTTEKAMFAKKAALDRLKDRDALYTGHQVLLNNLSLYVSKVSNIANTKQRLEVEKGKSRALTEKVSSISIQLEEAEKKVAAKQGEMDKVAQERGLLHPDEVNEQLARHRSMITNLTNLEGNIAILETSAHEAEEAGRAIRIDEETLASLQEKAREATAVLETATQKATEANNRLTTMNASLEDTLLALRQRLVTEHTECCPLCGQKLEHIHVEEDFRNWISPLAKEQLVAEQERVQANSACEHLKRKLNQLAGGIENKKQALTALCRKNREIELRIKEALSRYGLILDGEFSPILAKECVTRTLEAITAKENLLKQRQQEASALLAKWEKLSGERKPLEQDRQRLFQAKADAEKEVASNRATIEYTITVLGNTQLELQKEESSLNDQIGQWYPNWKEDVPTAKEVLRADAEKYLKEKLSYANQEKALFESRQLIAQLMTQQEIVSRYYPEVFAAVQPVELDANSLLKVWQKLGEQATILSQAMTAHQNRIKECEALINAYLQASGKPLEYLVSLIGRKDEFPKAQRLVQEIKEALRSKQDAVQGASKDIQEGLRKLGLASIQELPDKASFLEAKISLNKENLQLVEEKGSIAKELENNTTNVAYLVAAEKKYEEATAIYQKWELLNRYFGGTRFRTLVQTYILRPLLNNANIYLERITDRYKLTCSEENDQLSILVHDRYNKGQVRSATILSGGERFMISLALSLALSSLNRPDMNVNILFIDEGFGTLDERNLDSVMSTLERLQEIAGESNRRVGIISHREELFERIPVKIEVKRKGEGRSVVELP